MRSIHREIRSIHLIEFCPVSDKIRVTCHKSDMALDVLVAGFVGHGREPVFPHRCICVRVRDIFLHLPTDDNGNVLAPPSNIVNFAAG
jgi:hypothetical protein